MDPNVFIEPAVKEVLGYGVLGVAVIALTILYVMERRDRKEADKVADAVRDAAAEALEKIQQSRIDEMRSSIDAIRKGDELMSEMQASFEKRFDSLKGSVDGVKAAVDTLTNFIGRGR